MAPPDDDSLEEFCSWDDATAARLEGCIEAGDYRRRSGFLAASRLLLEAAIAGTHWTDRDALIWPALYSFRHFLELRLKQLSRDGAPLGLPQPPPNHRLERLWPPVRDALADHLGDSKKSIATVEKALRLFHHLDPGGDGLRYSTLRSGHPSVPRDLYLDPAALLELMRMVSDVLEAADMAFDHAMNGLR